MNKTIGEIMADLLESSLETASLDESGWHDKGESPGTEEGKYIEWLTIRNQETSVIEDVRRIRNNPMVAPDITLYGFVYHCKTGKLVEVPEAMEAGRPGKS